MVRSLESGTAFPVYFAGKWVCLVWGRVMSYVAGPKQYYLHENWDELIRKRMEI